MGKVHCIKYLVQVHCGEALCCVVRSQLKRHNLLHFEVFILETIVAMNYKYETIVVASLSSRHHAANLPATLSTTFNIQLTMACIVHIKMF